MRSSLQFRVADQSPGRDLSARLPSDLSIISEAIATVTRHCRECGVPKRIAEFKVSVVLSEALANAMEYGNGLDPQKHVELRVEVRETSITLVVEDEGVGFDPLAVPDPTAPDRLTDPDGRGIFLIRELVDDVSFNARGNAICMVLNRA